MIATVFFILFAQDFETQVNELFKFMSKIKNEHILNFQDFLRSCLNRDPTARPTARELLFHKVLFEVHSLKLVAAHRLVKASGKYCHCAHGYFLIMSYSSLCFSEFLFVHSSCI